MAAPLVSRRMMYLRVGSGLLIHTDLSVLHNHSDGDTKWFRDKHMMELLLLLREPLLERIQQQPWRQVSKTSTKEPKTAHSLITGETIKLSYWFTARRYRDICLLPDDVKKNPTVNETSSHSGGGFQPIQLYPEDLSVCVCEYNPSYDTTNELLQATQTSSDLQPSISNYFSIQEGNRRKIEAFQTATAKKKRAKLKKIVKHTSSIGDTEGGFTVQKASHPVNSDFINNQGAKLSNHERRVTNTKVSDYKICLSVCSLPNPPNKFTSNPADDCHEQTGTDHHNSQVKVNLNVAGNIESTVSTSDKENTSPCVEMASGDEHQNQEIFRSLLEEKEHSMGEEENLSLAQHTTNNLCCEEDLKAFSPSKLGKKGTQVKRKLSLKSRKVRGDSQTQRIVNQSVRETQQIVNQSSRYLFSDISDSDADRKQSKNCIEYPVVSLKHYSVRDENSSCDEIKMERKDKLRLHKDCMSSSGNTSTSVDLDFEHDKNKQKDLQLSEDRERNVNHMSYAVHESNEEQVHIKSIGNSFKVNSILQEKCVDMSVDVTKISLETASASEERDFKMSRGTYHTALNKYQNSKCQLKHHVTDDSSSVTSDLEDDNMETIVNKNMEDDSAETEKKESEFQETFTAGITNKSVNTASVEQDSKISRGTFHRNLNKFKFKNLKCQLKHHVDVDSSSAASDLEDDNVETPLINSIEDDSPHSELPVINLFGCESGGEVAAIQGNERSKEEQGKQGQTIKGKQGQTIKGKDIFKGDLGFPLSTDPGSDADSFVLRNKKVHSQCKHNSRNRKTPADSAKIGFSFHSPSSLDEELPSFSFLKTVSKSYLRSDETHEQGEGSGSEVEDADLPHIDLGCSPSDESMCRNRLNKSASVGDRLSVEQEVDECNADMDELPAVDFTGRRPGEDTNEQLSGISTSSLSRLESDSKKDVPPYRETASQPVTKLTSLVKCTSGAKSSRMKLGKDNQYNLKSFRKRKAIVGYARKSKVMKVSDSPKNKSKRDISYYSTPKNDLTKWWLSHSEKKKAKEKTNEVIDLVAIEEKMETSLTTIKRIEDLKEEHLQYLTKKNEDYLQLIFQGKKACQRHDMYHKSTACRAQMTYMMRYGKFSEDNLEVVMDEVVKLFCKKGSKHLDYVSKVLLQELLIKICMDVLHVNYEDAQEMF